MKQFHTHRMTPMKDGRQFCLKCHHEFQDKNFGDKLTLREFIDSAESGSFIPNDGSIGEVYVNDKLTNIEVQGWGLDFRGLLPEIYGQAVFMTLGELTEIEGEVALMWYNKYRRRINLY